MPVLFFPQTLLTPSLSPTGQALYYAPDDSPKWQSKLERYHLMRILRERLSEDFPSFVANLLGGEHDSLARNALAGFAEEWTPVLTSPVLQGWKPLKAFALLIATARSEGANRFVAAPPPDLFDRSAAAAILQKKYQERIDPDANISVSRHLVRLKWPECGLFRAAREQAFSKWQVEVYASAEWALVLALRYE